MIWIDNIKSAFSLTIRGTASFTKSYWLIRILKNQRRPRIETLKQQPFCRAFKVATGWAWSLGLFRYFDYTNFIEINAEYCTLFSFYWASYSYLILWLMDCWISVYLGLTSISHYTSEIVFFDFNLRCYIITSTIMNKFNWMLYIVDLLILLHVLPDLAMLSHNRKGA